MKIFKKLGDAFFEQFRKFTRSLGPGDFFSLLEKLKKKRLAGQGRGEKKRGWSLFRVRIR